MGADDLNNEKFVPNFFLENPNTWHENEEKYLDSTGQKEPWRKFWKGPRDRLYRYNSDHNKASKAHGKLMPGIDLATLEDILRVEKSNVQGERRYFLATETC